MSHPITLDPGRLEDLAAALRADNLINDAEVIAGTAPAWLTAFIVPQGFRPGYRFRRRAMELAGDLSEHIQVALVRVIPRDENNEVARDKAHELLGRAGIIFGYEPPVSDREKMFLELVLEVLPGVHVSMTDNLPSLGGDSLGAIELIDLIENRMGVKVDPQEVFSATSFRELLASWD
jgi:acyl carrier protein